MNTNLSVISLVEAMAKITDNELLLPAIQREYVWKRQDIEQMFDSLLRYYPINTLMFWRIKNIANQPLDFYKFLEPRYVSDETRNTEYIKNSLSDKERLIVIDGQQRLTSLYIGLYGTFAKDKNKPMSLYLRLDSKIKKNENDDKLYDFRFMTENNYNQLIKQGQVWLKMSDLMKPGYNIFSSFPQLVNNNEAMEIMRIVDAFPKLNLWYYDISDCNDIDDVLEIFTRTNNTGTRLSKGDLLLSVMTTNWMKNTINANARDFVKDVIDDVRRCGYNIDRDWVIKCCLVIFSPTSIKMKVHNFSSITDKIYENREELKLSIISTFEMIKRFGLLEKGLTSKLAVIPIVHYIYSQKIWGTINKAEKGHTVINREIRNWLFRSIVLNLFESGTDDILSKVKSIINDLPKQQGFPFDNILNTFNKLYVDEKTINGLLDTQKKYAFPILNIIFCNNNLDGKYDMDHQHPADTFKDLTNICFNSEADRVLANDGKTFNSVRNLQLLPESDNRSKNKTPLKEWLNNAKDLDIIKKTHLIPNNVSYCIEDFKTYIDARSLILKEQLAERLGYTLIKSMNENV